MLSQLSTIWTLDRPRKKRDLLQGLLCEKEKRGEERV